jgi:hypothetical protein
MMLEQFEQIITAISSYLDKVSSGNNFMAGAIGIWLLGVGSYLLKDVPRRIYGFILKHTTTELVLTNEDQIFYDVLSWIDRKGYSKKFRNIKYISGRSGWENDAKKSVGYGSHVGNPLGLLSQKKIEPVLIK